MPPRLLSSAAVLLLVSSLARAQAPLTEPAQPPSSSAQPTFTLHATTRLVLTDVTVTDRNGNPVHHLPATAFHITQDNTPEAIASFEEHTASEIPAAPSPSAPEPANTYSNDFLLHAPPVLNVLVLDITNLSLPDQMYLSFQLTRFFEALAPGQVLAIYERAGPASVLLQGFTADHDLLLAAIHRGLPRFPPRGAAYLTDLDTLQQISTYLGDLPGRKNVIWFSGGSTLFLTPDATRVQDIASWRRVYDLLEAKRIAIFPIDARGLTTSGGFAPRPSVSGPGPAPPGTTANGPGGGLAFTGSSLVSQHALMSEIAEATGGRATFNNNGLKQAALRVTTEGADFYSLTYSPSNYQQDDKWHKVHISLDLPGYTLSYRRGYFADGINDKPTHPLGPVTRIRLSDGAKVADPTHAPPILFHASVLPDDGFAAIPNPKKNTTLYDIHYTIPAANLTLIPTNGGNSMSVVLASLAFNLQGEVLDQKLERVTLSINKPNLDANPSAEIPVDQHLQLAKGTAYLVLAVVEEQSGRSGNLQVSVDVPAPPKHAK